jgi:predicted ATPase/class 3 adenylate cyclase
MDNRSTGTVTFLFTDVQGSTRLWEEHPHAMQAALARHDALLRKSIEGCGGHIVKHRGDGFSAAFSTARQAMEAAVMSQLTLSAEPWDETGPIRVRMAIHTGAAEERDGDYFGTEINRVARLLDAGHGGQILVSGATEQVVRHELPRGMELLDLGEHRLKDLTRADHIYQLAAPGLALDFPLLATLTIRPNNLPIQTTTFLGREQDISEVKRLLEHARLVALLGTGGVGKTRLALQVAVQVLENYPDGVCFTDLAPLADPRLLPQTVASALAVQERPGEPMQITLLQALRDKHLLLLLDNCEHLIEACAQLADDILRTCPKIQILATSREPLRLAEEVRWQVSPLPVPEPDQQGDLDQLGQAEAVRLFLDRAAAIVSGFRLTRENGPAIAEIVRHLDGIPLAIELAAARVNVLSSEQIAQRLDNRFQLLKRGSRAALPRQQTLEALIDWSYDLLSEAEQLLFQCLSVFAGGFTLEAAETICAGNGVEGDDVMELLGQLAEKSLVVVDEQRPRYRYRLLESLRQYARKQLRQHGYEDHLQREHARYFLSLAEQAAPNLFSDVQAEWFTRLRAELDNFRVVLEWARTRDLEIGLRLATALWRVWWLGGQVAEGRAQLERLWGAQVQPVSLKIRLDALHVRGNLAFRDGDYTEARVHFEEMRLLAEQSDDLERVVKAVSALGGMLVEQMDYEAAAALLRESLRLEAKLSDVPSNPWVRIDLGLVELGRGEYSEAASLFQESLAMAERDQDQWRIVIARCCQGLVALVAGDLNAARSHFEISLQLSWDEQFQWVIPFLLEGFAGIAVHQKLFLRAVRLAGAATVQREAAGLPLAPLWQQLLKPPLESAKQQLEPTVWKAAWDEGQAMSIEQAVDYALDNTELLLPWTT